ncbi:MAG: glycosyltransferase family 4 protein [Pseudomonadota bacterium]
MTIRCVAVTAYSDIAEAHLFIGLVQSGCRVTVLCPEDAPHCRLMAAGGVDLYPLRLNRRVDTRGIALIRHHLKSMDARILHLFNNKAVTNGLLAATGLDVRVIAYRGVSGREKLYSPYAWLTYLNPRIKRVVCVSEAVRRAYDDMSVMGIGPSQERFVTIYKGHSQDWYHPLPQGLSGFGVPSDAFVVGTIATMRSRNPKGIPELLEAVRYMDESIHVIIVGQMDEKRINRIPGREKWQGRVHFTGMRRDASAIIGCASVYVLPSVKKEGLPKTVIEAMAQGVPPVVTDAGGSPELVVHGKSGLVIPAGDVRAISDAVMKLKNDAALRASMGIAARERIASHFHYQTTVDKTLALYRELAGS